MSTNVKNYREIFFEETYEHLSEVEAGLLGLEHDPDDSGLLDQVFRGIHSIKGGAATFGIDAVAEFSHSLENHLDKLRAGERRNDTESSEAMLRSVDCLRALVEAALEETEPDDTTCQNIAHITSVLAQCGAADFGTSVDQPGEVAEPAASDTTTQWRIVFAPGPDAFQNGLDPTLIWRELDGMGQLDVRLDDSRLPNLADMDPTKCHLAWEATLVTDQSADEIEQAFFFHADDAELVIEPASTATVEVEPVSSPSPADTSVGSTGKLRKTFGDWLVQRGVVSAAQMLKALDLQYKHRLPVGQLALREGVMNVDQVFETLEWGSVNGERFGETAISRGFLTAEGLGKLLDLQVRELPSICEALLEMEAATSQVLEQEQNEYRAAGGVIPASEEFVAPEEAEQSKPAPAQSSVEEGTSLAVNLEMLKQNRELIGDFLSDCREHLEDAERQALQMETDSTSEEQLHALYRAFHTIKGVASFVGLTQITELAHAAEDVLNLAREGQLHLAGEPFELVLASLDSLRHLADGVPELLQYDESPPADANTQQLIRNLQAVAAGEQPTALPVKPAAASTPQNSAPAPGSRSTEVSESPQAIPTVTNIDSSDSAPANKPKAQGHEMKETVRVDRSRLDELVDMIGELVIGEAMVRQEVEELAGDAEVESLTQLGRTVRELQEMSLSLRMVPIAATFQKMHRIVRDVSRKLGKQVNFQVEGEETELDKTMVDQLGDPLMHMVRNAVDHGIEMPDARTAAGKPAEGNVTLRAFLRNGNFFIELVDDGKGLDREKILQKAVERGVVQAADCETMPDADVWMLVFAPGFSTAAVVTDVSGRGVGMDVVKRAIEALNGSIEVESTAGNGSVFRVRLPLTMAIVDGLSVSLGTETFILPLVSVVESVRPRAQEIKTIVGRGEVVQVREETIPLVRLHRVFNRPARELDPARALVVIVETDGRRLAVLVDELLGQVQAVMKSLETNYEKVPGIAGATILGNGEVAFILDVQGIAKLHANTRCGRVPERSSTSESSQVESE